MTAIDDPAAPVARNPRREAQELVGDAFDARVLERSPWAAARWLGAWRRLPPLPPAYADTRLALHRLVVYVASPARQRVNGKMALRWTFGGLGTPFFGDDEQVRVAGAGLVRQRGPAAEAAEITTLNAAAELVLDGPPDLAWAEKFDVPAAGGLDERLAVAPGAAAFLGDWFGFAWSVLEELRAEPASTGPSRTQLWPEHFDAAFDCLPEERRCTFGASPGDAAVPQPYLYVLPWRFDEAPPNAFWNSTSFRGAILPFGHLVDAEDQRALALRFLRRSRALLLEACPMRQ